MEGKQASFTRPKRRGKDQQYPLKQPVMCNMNKLQPQKVGPGVCDCQDIPGKDVSDC